jgi:hypothetical protein
MQADHEELMNAVGESPKQAEQTKYPPTAVPYLNDAYTYADRQNELELLDNLLSHRLSSVRAELSMIKDINRTRVYPNIVFQNDATKAG